ncbi:late competence development ComFB family protein [Leptolyngbya sp. FACHB-261]|uniref:late competence development ComFB family protein n=1 Tax=Leptolyngbya sp. FACHB-261 TaxID=2692806 RepID=UPI001688E148|nr:late competence development ComFB family protein [Leptolyngbya sp. FACHB-261]MBD2099807.1 late competence development ComFB family protein [Leptolyngbya sp. FACHB-261]
MTIEEIVEQAFCNHCLTPSMEFEINHLCESDTIPSIGDYLALDRLQAALRTGEVRTLPRKQYINVMEELVLMETMAQADAFEADWQLNIDIGEVVAYALNRLQPLYATTHEGAKYQRQRGRAELQGVIATCVRAAITHHLGCPAFFPERRVLKEMTPEDVADQVSAVLEVNAERFALTATLSESLDDICES